MKSFYHTLDDVLRRYQRAGPPHLSKAEVRELIPPLDAKITNNPHLVTAWADYRGFTIYASILTRLNEDYLVDIIWIGKRK